MQFLNNSNRKILRIAYTRYYLILFKYYFDYNNLRKHPLHLKHSQFLRSQITATNALIVGGRT